MYNYLTLTRIAGGFLFRSAHISVGKYSLDLNRLKPIKKAINPRAAIGTRLIAEAGNQTRTDDPLITSEVLYQLSYSGTRGYAHQLLYRLRAKVQEKNLTDYLPSFSASMRTFSYSTEFSMEELN